LTSGFGGNLRALLTKREFDQPITSLALAVESGHKWTFANDSIGFPGDVKEKGPLADKFFKDFIQLPRDTTLKDTVRHQFVALQSKLQQLNLVLTDGIILFEYEDLVDLGISAHFHHLRNKLFISKIETNVMIDATVMDYARLGDAWTMRVDLSILRYKLAR